MRYKDVKKVSKLKGVPEESLIKAFEIEKDFHQKILRENDQEKRKRMYREVYDKVHLIYYSSILDNKTKNPKDRIVKILKKELKGKSILDLGCGRGFFLRSIASCLNHKKLVGIDTSTSVLPKSSKDIRFINADIFDLKEKFDVILSNQVLEHIAPSDLSSYMDSIENALARSGLLIIRMPNRLFGPSDVTRIIDCSRTNRIRAIGTHLNESTYTELIPILREHGFIKFRTIFPAKIQCIFPNLRISPAIYVFIENNPTLLNILYKIRFQSRCIAKFDICLICEYHHLS